MSDELKSGRGPTLQRPRSPRVPVDFAVGLERLTPPFGRTIDAEVNGVWTDHTDGKQRIGVKLLDANGWFAD